MSVTNYFQIVVKVACEADSNGTGVPPASFGFRNLNHFTTHRQDAWATAVA